MPFQILVPVLECGDEENSEEGQGGETRADGRESREELEDNENCRGKQRWNVSQPEFEWEV